MSYGPDNIQSLDQAQIFQLTIPKNAEVKLTFTSGANWENTICIYNGDTKKYEKGNQGGRDLNPETINRNLAQEVILQITGWHKQGSASPGLKWLQSNFQVTGNPDKSISVGFNDGGGTSFQNIVANISFN